MLLLLRGSWSNSKRKSIIYLVDSCHQDEQKDTRHCVPTRVHSGYVQAGAESPMPRICAVKKLPQVARLLYITPKLWLQLAALTATLENNIKIPRPKWICYPNEKFRLDAP